MYWNFVAINGVIKDQLLEMVSIQLPSGSKKNEMTKS
jgi:hypothetical protein